eukprot:jgi/Mesvir1/14112/Mv20247-RA.1
MSCQFDSGVSGNNVTVKLTFNPTLALKYPSTDTTIKYALGTREKTTQTVTKQNNANILNVNLGDVAGWAFGNAETNFITTSGTITVTIPGSTFLVGTSTNNEITEAVRFTLAFNPAGSQTPVALGDLTDLNVANCVWQFGSNAGVRALTDARVPSVVTGVADKFGTTASVLYIAFNAGKLATVASTTVVTWSAGHGTSGTLDLKNFETTLVTKDVDRLRIDLGSLFTLVRDKQGGWDMRSRDTTITVTVPANCLTFAGTTSGNPRFEANADFVYSANNAQVGTRSAARYGAEWTALDVYDWTSPWTSSTGTKSIDLVLRFLASKEPLAGFISLIEKGTPTTFSYTVTSGSSSSTVSNVAVGAFQADNNGIVTARFPLGDLATTATAATNTIRLSLPAGLFRIGTTIERAFELTWQLLTSTNVPTAPASPGTAYFNNYSSSVTSIEWKFVDTSGVARDTVPVPTTAWPMLRINMGNIYQKALALAPSLDLSRSSGAVEIKIPANTVRIGSSTIINYNLSTSISFTTNPAPAQSGNTSTTTESVFSYSYTFKTPDNKLIGPYPSSLPSTFSFIIYTSKPVTLQTGKLSLSVSTGGQLTAPASSWSSSTDKKTHTLACTGYAAPATATRTLTLAPTDGGMAFRVSETEIYPISTHAIVIPAPAPFFSDIDFVDADTGGRLDTLFSQSFTVKFVPSVSTLSGLDSNDVRLRHYDFKSGKVTVLQPVGSMQVVSGTFRLTYARSWSKRSPGLLVLDIKSNQFQYAASETRGNQKVLATHYVGSLPF